MRGIFQPFAGLVLLLLPSTAGRAADLNVGTATARTGQKATGVIHVPAGVDAAGNIPVIVINGGVHRECRVGCGTGRDRNASKHGLIGLTRTLAAEWGGRGVRSNAVCPGWVKTEMDAADQTGGSYTDEGIERMVPMGRFANPTDITPGRTPWPFA